MRVALVNTPFADWDRPSVALSQIAAHTKREFGDSVEVEVVYPNIDLALLIGAAEYRRFASNADYLTTGVGEWLFRQMAFPDTPDNATEYFRRYFCDEGASDFRARVLHIRERLRDFCDDIITKYRLADSDIVGFTSMFAQNLPAFALARLVKERNPEVVTVIGGANCEAPMGAVLAENVAALDYVFSGPSLHTFPGFVRCVLEGRLDLADRIPGIMSKRNVKIPRFRRAVGRDRDIDDYIHPDYQGFVDTFSQAQEALRADAGEAEPILYFETSRGCWWGERSHCTFCGLNGLDMGYRTMSPEKALQQFEWLFDFAPWCRTFHGTDNIMPRNYARDVFPKMKPPAGASLFYEVKVPVADRDMRTMAEAGVSVVQPGIEALATSTLQLMAKGTTVFLNLQFLQKCLRYGIQPLWNLLIGFPGEEASVYQKYETDLPNLVHLPPPEDTFLVRFDRYSPYFTKRHEYGLDLRPLDFYRLVYPVVPEEQIFDLAYFFADENLAPYQTQSIEWLWRLKALTDAWRDAWKDGTPPRLVLMKDASGDLGVLDTRLGTPRWTPVEPDGETLLRRLASPVRRDRIPADQGLPAVRVEAMLTEFADRKWLLEEDDTVFSLVTLDERARH
ncbi:RiPP maturation radical SAM C-methyltransferase [Thermopolyspora sp. NPDC052614]|uniref:RiPP maturation radical SAM C-methyltransferase n=1 Tax=Thermopolyspora sp. NPDC052614 TaxID=3155682 RepID=UPI003436E744